jgi:hypothetical protein
VGLHSSSQQLKYLEDAMTTFNVAVKCQSASPSDCKPDADDTKHPSALEAYQVAIELLPRLAALGLDLQSCQQILTLKADGLARDTAARAIQSGQPDKAVELLEEGRTTFWSQVLQLRSPLDKLQHLAPELAQMLKNTSHELEQGLLWNVSTSLSYTQQKLLSMEQEVVHYHLLNEKWLATLEEVWKLDGFEPDCVTGCNKQSRRYPECQQIWV